MVNVNEQDDEEDDSDEFEDEITKNMKLEAFDGIGKALAVVAIENLDRSKSNLRTTKERISH